MSLPEAGGISLVEASPGDCDFIARATIEAERAHTGRGIWDCLMPYDVDGRDEILKAAFSEASKSDPNCHFSYSRFLLAKASPPAESTNNSNNNSIFVGGACAFRYPDYGVSRSKDGILQALVNKGAQPSIEAAQRGWQEMAFFEEACPAEVEYDNSWMIEAVFTDENYRRRGISSSLIDALYERGRGTGCSRAMIVCSVGNAPGLRLYHSKGFSLIGTGQSDDCLRKLGYSGYHVLVKNY